MSVQEPHPTVGDTLTIVRHIAAPLDAVVQARAPLDSSIATLVSPPMITREGDSVRIAYSVALWAPGKNDLVIPGPIVVTTRGRVDTLGTTTIPIEVASILPGGRPSNTVAPRPARPWIPGADRSALPLLVLLPLALLLLAALGWWWRRRGRAAITLPVPASMPVTLDAARLDRWLQAGEARLALEHLEWMVRERADMAEWRAKADALRFAAASGPELEALVRDGWSRATVEPAP